MKMLYRYEAGMPYQEWRPFPPEAIVLIKNSHGERRIGLAKDFWWGYGWELDGVAEGVILAAARLDRPRVRWDAA